MFAIIVFLQWHTFADSAYISAVGEVLHFVVSVASWWWILFAVLAGKLMTNTFVYGSILNLDVYLRQLRNIMKNFANFALWFMFLVGILKSIFSSKWGGTEKWTIVNFLLAWVLVQMSWFIMWAIMDLSTIATSAIGSFPSQLISSDATFMGSVSKNLWPLWNKKYTIHPDAKGKDKVFTQTAMTDNTWMTNDDTLKVLDIIMPNYKTVSGPLLYLGFSVLDFSNFPEADKFNSSTNVDFWWLLVYLGINGMVIILFTVAMFLLFVINLVRVGMLRLLIPLSPFIIIITLFKKQLGLEKLPERFSMQKVVVLLFKPVLYVAYLSLMMIFLSGVTAILNSGQDKPIEIPDQNVTITSTKDSSKIEAPGILSFQLDGAKNTFAWIIVYLFTFFLMWQLVKMAAQWWTGIKAVDDRINSLTKGIEGVAGNVGVVPIPTGGWVKMVGTTAAKDILNRIWQAWWQWIAAISGEQQEQFLRLMGEGKDRDSMHKTTLHKAAENINDSELFWRESKKLAGEIKGGFSINDGQWSEELKTWLETRASHSQKVKLNNAEVSVPPLAWKSLETYFKSGDGTKVWEYVKQQMGAPTVPGSWTPESVKFGTHVK